MSSDPQSDVWGFLRYLREDGIVMQYQNGKLTSVNPVTDPRLREFITTNRLAIIEELKQEAGQNEKQ
jgi:hypothetical protein